MKPIDRRKLLATLRLACERAGLTLEEDPDAGSGSHGSLLFVDANGTHRLRVVIVYSRDLSPGVQRAILHSVRQRAESARLQPELRALAHKVHGLLEMAFSA